MLAVLSLSILAGACSGETATSNGDPTGSPGGSPGGVDGGRGGGGTSGGQATVDPTKPNGVLVEVLGEGTVTSTPAGIDCGATCFATFGGGKVTLGATAKPGYVFSGWSGPGIACHGTDPCEITLGDLVRVTADFVPGGAGKTYYVATNGSDANDGLTVGAPFKTITRGIAAVAPGDTIAVRAGTYSETIRITKPASATAWITLRGYDAERPILTSAGADPTVYVYHSKCDEDVIGNGSGNTDCQAMFWALRHIEIHGSPSGGGDGNAIKIDTPKVRLIDDALCCSKADVVKLVRTANDVEVRDSTVWQDPAVVTPSANAQGIDIVGADRPRIIRNYVHDVPDIGIYAKGNSREPLFDGNRLERIGVHALMLGQSTDADRLADGTYETYDGIVRNNVVVDTGWSCLATASSSNARFVGNSCYDTGKVTHGSVLLSNESEVGQAGVSITIAQNVFVGSPNKPILKIGSNAMTDYATLRIEGNMYFTTTGAAPTFAASDFFDPVPFDQWKTRYAALTGASETSVVADPRFAATTGPFALSLLPTSPCLGAGAASPLLPTDIRGVPRPAGSGADIGAYEY